MHAKRPLGTILVILVGGCSLVLAGCGAGTEMSDDEPEGMFSQIGDTSPDPEADWPGSAPAGPDSASSAVETEPGAIDLRKELTRPDFLPSPPRSLFGERDPEPVRAVPAFPGGGPTLVAPQNAPAPQAFLAEPSSTRIDDSRPMAVAPQPFSTHSEPLAVRSHPAVPRMSPDESGPAAEATSPEDTSFAPEDDSEAADYKVVKVFYGTDRNAARVQAPDGAQGGYAGWYSLTVLSAATTVILTLVAFRYARRPTMLVLAGTGVTATIVLGVVTTLARLQGEPPGPRPKRTYGNQRGELEMGTCEVSIPKGHEPGEVERPSVFRFEFREDPRRHVVLLGVEEQPAEAFFAGLKVRVEASRQKEAFVFVHGFNVTFAEAAHRTAQLAHDLKFDGAPIFFSWPSQGGVLQYSVDETNVVWAVPHLKEFLAGIAERSGAEAVHLIAHSMGNRALTSALERLSYEMQEKMPMFREVVLTAPDIDAEVFRRDIVPAIVPTADRVTLYASSNDEALKLSKTIHGYRRAGDSGDQLLVIPGVDTIDVSTVDTSLIGHYYYGSNTSVIADLLDLINEAKPPQLRRWLEPRRFGQLVYWVFHGDRPTLGASPTPDGDPVLR